MKIGFTSVDKLIVSDDQMNIIFHNASQTLVWVAVYFDISHRTKFMWKKCDLYSRNYGTVIYEYMS